MEEMGARPGGTCLRPLGEFLAWGGTSPWSAVVRKLLSLTLRDTSLFCSFGRSQGEECDDMNKLSGDGCSLFCRQEDSFNCIGKSVSCLGA